MEQILKQFTTDSLYNATLALMEKLQIKLDRVTAERIPEGKFWPGKKPQYIAEALDCIKDIYFIGFVNDQSLQGEKESISLDDVEKTVEQNGKYNGMAIFACDAKTGAKLTRTNIANLTRAFNRLASACPVILLVRQEEQLSISTCERTEYVQKSRIGTGEKLGKVNILRNINCDHPHRGHVDILCSLGDKRYATFEELYKHWLEVFSNELLTRKFYNELSDWYAWAVQVAKFPNNLNSETDDAKYNHESCIRLITRLIFVWFLKQKKLIPDEFFDESYIHDNLIDNFDPHDRQNLMYNAEESRYYRLVLQNLFFAMLNCPIVAEGKTTANNRRFMRESFQGKNPDYNIKTVMRYKSEFMEGGADKFVKLANSSVPFLNGGLFDCLDNDNTKMFYDGFSERKESLRQLSLPDYLFFGEEVGKGIDLSEWYGDKNKKKVSARGLIDILKRYSFTIEENTPYDQEVSLDPELLGKVFENLLAAFNPETQTSARKQTGSFYTPREIVQYMVDESLVAHLKRMCGDEQEPLYRSLISYATEDVELTDKQRTDIMHALYNCRVLDPACGSGAFPMGVLQQMVHVLKRIDPTNDMWNSMMIDIAIDEARKELQKVVSGNEEEKAKIEENRKARLDDIESAFNKSVNDPDYARKLYLIEHCIYGVDIQPIATQISKLRFFISLVVDQKPTQDAKSNFGIRPLPNLEAKFVTANTLIPVDYDSNVVESAPKVIKYKAELKDLNHRIFLSKKNSVKEELKQEIKETRENLAAAIEETGFISSSVSHQLASWNMFDQNASAPFFDSEWMFGVNGKFDIVLGNPPWGAKITKEDKAFYKSYYDEIDSSTPNTFAYFVGWAFRHYSSIVSFVLPDSLLTKDYAKTRKLLSERLQDVIWYQNAGVPSELKTFVYVDHDVCIVNISSVVKNEVLLESHSYVDSKMSVSKNTRNKSDVINPKFDYAYNLKVTDNDIKLLHKLMKYKSMNIFMQCHEGIHSGNIREKLFLHEEKPGLKPLFYGGGAGDTIKPYYSKMSGWYVDYRKDIIVKSAGDYASLRDENIFIYPKIYITRTGNPFKAFYDKNSYASNNFFSLQYSNYAENTEDNLLYLLPFINSNVCRYFIRTFAAPRLGNTFIETKIIHLMKLPVPEASDTAKKLLVDNVSSIVKKLKTDINAEIRHLSKSNEILVYKIYNLTYDEVLVIDPSTPITREEYDNFKIEE